MKKNKRMKMMDIKMVKIDDIVPYENNPRHNADAIEPVKESIRQFGFKVPMILDKENVIVAGHTRYEAAKALGMTEVPVIYADDLSEEQVRKFRLVDNKTAEFAEWDFAKLEEELAELDFGDFDFGFDIDFDEAEETEIVEDEPPEPPEEPRAKVGDLYILGRWVYCKKCGKRHYIS
jgi:site-specific DNA-methyltransferase (adenine-specific)